MEDSTNHFDHLADAAPADASHGWQKVTSKRRKNPPNLPATASTTTNSINNKASENGNVFRAIEEHSTDRRRRVVEAQRAADFADSASDLASLKARSKGYSDDDDSEVEEGKENGVVEENKEKKKKKKEKKPKVSVAEAASKIVDSELLSFIADVTASYGSQEDIQLMRFADYFGRAFSGVGSAQFPWVKLLRESALPKLIETPISSVSDDIYKISADWINQRSLEALGSFILGLLDSILADLASQVGNVKGSKKGAQQPSSRSQVAVFVVLAIVLRRKPEALVGVLPTLRDNGKYLGQDKLPLIVWMVAQASQGDLPVGLYAWAHNLLPILNSKSGNNPLSRDLILQLVERILSGPKARSILMSNFVRRGERLIPPSSFEILIRLTCPASSSRIKATERFEAVYPTLKDIALAGVPGSKAMKQHSQQIFSIAIKAAGESIPELAKVGTEIFIWSLAQNSDCYKQWEKLYLDNLEASVAVLRKMTQQWRELNLSHPSREAFKATLHSFQEKNEKALSGGDASDEGLFKEADKYCKVLASRLSSGHGCLKATAIIAVMLAVGGAVAMSPNLEVPFDYKTLQVTLSSRLSVMLSSFQTV